ncbi:hypothetical protein HX005_17210 [Acinetobacter sp. R933-2]|uniref:hypothetical protein n=1 Tax=Acinetobacter sp. R933-2 TaxID=2746728 RepID=UPI0025754EA7|nr:hypothetical protein [Acinetobacter sp. R933-2]MDM1249114.1 hypothetical protein [Acinetobacter sp. R933-2]
MTTKYVIRQNNFSYNDEYFSTYNTELGHIQAIYDNKQEAEQAYKTLIVEALYQQDSLYEYNGDTEIAQQAYEFIVENNIEVELEEDENLDDIDEFETLPPMSEDDAFKFAKLSGILWYQLLEFEDNQPIYILWSNTQNDYLKGEYNNTFDSTDENFSTLENFELSLFEYDFNVHIFDKTLDQISDSPEILKTLATNTPNIVYAEDRNSIVNIDWDDLHFTELKALNALLKQPIFEVRQITLEQLNKISNGEEDE